MGPERQVRCDTGKRVLRTGQGQGHRDFESKGLEFGVEANLPI